jgi:hypothetical protein
VDELPDRPPKVEAVDNGNVERRAVLGDENQRTREDSARGETLLRTQVSECIHIAPADGALGDPDRIEGGSTHCGESLEKRRLVHGNVILR